MSNKMKPRGGIRRTPLRAAGSVNTPTSNAAMRDALGPKIVGEHRWNAVAFYAITADQARAATQGSAIKLDGDKITSFAVGCADCSLGFSDAAGDPCEPAE